MYIKIHFYLMVWMAFLFWKGSLSLFLLFYLCDFVHEVAHIVMALLLNVNVIELYFMPFGISAKYQNEISPTKECLISVAGPLMSVFLFIFSKNPVIKIINFIIFAMNMVPVYPLDGGRITRIISIKVFGKKNGELLIKGLTNIMIFLMIIFSIWMILLMRRVYFVLFTGYVISLVYQMTLKEKIIGRIMYLQTDK